MWNYLHSMVVSTEADPITAILTRDWAALGGWSLAVGLGLYVVIALTREWLVPGQRYRRLEEASIKSSDAIDALTKQNGQLIVANQITEHFFKETVPKRGEVRQWDLSGSGDESESNASTPSS